MHPVIETILKTKDLAKAGDLFSIEDEEIEQDCSSALSLINEIITQADYVTVDSVQSVVEICVTRITSAIRVRDAIENHIQALVKILQSCLEFNLESSPSRADSESPHAKIVSDVLSCIFQNYSKKMVMEMATPVAVLFLDKGNTELTRNITSYLSLAVINHAHLVVPHVDCVIRSLAAGNKSLLKLLGPLFDAGPERLNANIDALIGLLSRSETPEDRITLLELCLKMCSKRPKLFVPHVAVLTEHLSSAETATLVLSMAELLAKDSTQVLLEHKEQLMEVAKGNPQTAPQVARIIGSIGRLNEVEAEECIDYLGNQLVVANTSYLPVLLQQLLLIGQKFPTLLRNHMDTVATFGESKEVEVKRLVARLLQLLDSPEQQVLADNHGSLSKISVGKRAGNPDKHSHHDIITRNHHSPRPPSIASIGSDQPSIQELPVRDPIHQFCEKHLATIKSYIEKLCSILPLPVKCTVEEKKKRKYRYVRLYFSCAKRDSRCLYPNSSYFTLKSRLPRLWIHLMFLNLQAKDKTALRQDYSTVQALRSCWECLQSDASDTFVRLATASFPSQKEQQALRSELWEARFCDVITLEPVSKQWSCFMCNNPDKLSGFIKPDGTPGIAGQLKEKKGKWGIFKRWKKRYFTLSGEHITYQKSGNKLETLSVNHIESVRAIRKKPRDMPKAFEIFTEDGLKYKFKSNDSKNVERWVQCLNLALSKSKKGRCYTVS